jgi:hypothetical protein
MTTCTVFRVESSNCGPFRAYKYPHEVILDVLQVQENNGFLQFIRFLVKPGVIGGILLAMWYVSWLKHVAASYHTMERSVYYFKILLE